MYQNRIWHNEIEGSYGLALSHPLYHLIGIAVKHIPLGEFGYRINLISSVAGAFGVANCFLLVFLWTGKIYPAVLSALTLGLSWTMWQFSSIAEDYSLYVALLLTELIWLVKYINTGRRQHLYFLALFNGLAISVHMCGIISLFCYLVFLSVLLYKRQIKLRTLGPLAGFWVLGASVYLLLIFKHLIASGDLGQTISSALFGTSWQGAVLNTSMSLKLIAENVIFLLYNFPTPNFLLLFIGMFFLGKSCSKQRFSCILGALLVLYFLFAFRYTVADRYAFFLPFYSLSCVVIGFGFHKVSENIKKDYLKWLVLVFSFLPVIVYALTPAIAAKAGFGLGMQRKIPYRNDYTWFLQPWKTREISPQTFAEHVFEIIEPNGVIYADGTTVYALLYAQEVQKKREDIRIVSSHSKGWNQELLTPENTPNLLKECAVYIVTAKRGYCPSFLIEDYNLEESGIVWRVVDKRNEGPMMINQVEGSE
jgi:hypothetical protein